MQTLQNIAMHWPQILESLGIIGGLFFTGFNLVRDIRIRKAETIIRITSQHREIWAFLMTQGVLTKLFDPKRDVAVNPPANDEKRSVGFLINHLRATFYAQKAGIYVQPFGLGGDIRRFFRSPVPHAVWLETKSSHDPEFAAFVDRWISN